jgi:3-dehydrosphinganine reductase
MADHNGKKNAVITGGSSGLGFAMAAFLAKQGYRTFLIARDTRKLDNAVHALKQHAYPCAGFRGDVTSVSDMERIAAEIHRTFGTVDFLIVNASDLHVNLVAESPYEHLKQDLGSGLWGAIVTAKSFLPILNMPSKILFISSALGLMGIAGYAAYCAAKAGMINFAETLRREVKYKGIAVYVVCPSDIDTPQYRAEQQTKPAWMKTTMTPRGSPMPAPVAARKILRKCKGGRFFITITSDVFFLTFLTKLLPRRIRDLIVDSIFPRPKS